LPPATRHFFIFNKRNATVLFDHKNRDQWSRLSKRSKAADFIEFISFLADRDYREFSIGKGRFWP